MYKQKGMGLARHSTKSVSQFRGGYKYSAIKKLKDQKQTNDTQTLRLRVS